MTYSSPSPEVASALESDMKAAIDDLMILICSLEIVTFVIGRGTSSTPFFVHGLKAVMI